jgi:hypothetical protein
VTDLRDVEKLKLVDTAVETGGSAYVPPTMEMSQPDGTSTASASPNEPKDLAAILQEANLSQYETALRELGASFGADLAELEEDDLVETGMKKLEVTRLLRIAQQVE